MQSIEIQHTIEDIQGVWALLFGSTEALKDRQLAIWLMRYDSRLVRDAIAQTALKFEKLNGEMGSEYIAKYASACMNRLYTEAQVKGGALPAIPNM